jgi:hypothetical protein
MEELERAWPEIVPSPQGGRDRRFAALLVSALTLFAVAVHGYHPYAEDGGLYVAGVKRLLDPALYPHSAEFVLEPMRFSLFARAVAAMVRLTHLSLHMVLLGLHLASVWATLYAAWMLAVRCWAGRAARAGAVTLLACWLGLPIAGTALLFMDPYLTARSFSTPCMVMALVGALDMTAAEVPVIARGTRWRGFALWLGSMALAAGMHPLMAAYALGASLMLLCARARSARLRSWGMAALCAAAVGLAAALQATAKPETADYVSVALTRSYWFLSAWRWFEVAGLVAPLLILGWFGWGRCVGVLHPVHRDTTAMDGACELRGRQTHISESRHFDRLRAGCGTSAFVAEGGERVLARMAVAVGATAVVIALLFARAGAATHLVARMQPLRAFQVVYLVMTLILGAHLGEQVLRRSLWRWAATLALLGGTMQTVARNAYPDSRYIEAPWTQATNPWVQAFLWVRDHTPKDALFALDPDYINAAAPGGQTEDAQCFRAIAERSSLADYSKDGGEASIAPDLTEEWTRAQAAQRGLRGHGPIDVGELAPVRRLGVSWVVLVSSATGALECPYRNDAVAVCRLR